MANKKENSSNMRLAGLFLMLVLGLIAVSILFKLFLIIKSSSIDGSHRFSVSFLAKNEVEVISFSPQTHAIAILKIKNLKDSQNLSDFLLYPVDANVSIDSQNLDKLGISSILLKTLFNFNSPNTNLTSFDTLRLLIFSKSVSPASIYETNFSSDLSSQEKSYIFSNFFQDTAINQENTSIEIVNATSSFGLGARLAALITNIGGNVVLVSTSDNQEETSRIIYSMPTNYTLKKFSSFLQVPIEKTDTKGVADMTIILGRDSLKNLKF